MQSKLYNTLKSLIEQNDNKSRHLLDSASLKEALAHLDAVAQDLGNLKVDDGVEKPKDAFAAFGIPLIGLEQQSKESDAQPWRFAFDAPKAGDNYIGNPVIQICSGKPDYHRFVMEFTPEDVQPRFDSLCIDANPILSNIRTKDVGANGPSLYEASQLHTDHLDLETRRQQDEEAGVQRIAILGTVRLVVAGPQAKEAHQALAGHIERQCNEFLNVFEDANGSDAAQGEPSGPFRTVNGGWAGKLEGNSVGMCLISNLIGVMEQAKFKREPITIMPSIGSYDHVEGVGQSNYFEVPGTWGDDSKYLLGFSTAAIAFEPYGVWTDIEIGNAVAQGLPVVIIRNPNDPVKAMEEVSIDLPEGKKGTYRKYSDLAEGSAWLKRCVNARFLDRFIKEQPDLNCQAQLEQLKQDYTDGKMVLPQLVEQALQMLSNAQQRSFKEVLVKQHGGMLEHLSNEDKADVKMAILAVKQNPDAIEFVSPAIQDYAAIQKLAAIRDWAPNRIAQANVMLDFLAANQSPSSAFFVGEEPPADRGFALRSIDLEMLADTQNLVQALNGYRKQRSDNPNEYYYHGFFRHFGGYSRAQKLDAVDSLLQCLDEKSTDKTLTTEQWAVLKQGQLGQVIAKWEQYTNRKLDEIIKTSPQPEEGASPAAPSA